jgi:hypothetical protein
MKIKLSEVLASGKMAKETVLGLCYQRKEKQ